MLTKPAAREKAKAWMKTQVCAWTPDWEDSITKLILTTDQEAREAVSNVREKAESALVAVPLPRSGDPAWIGFVRESLAAIALADTAPSAEYLKMYAEAVLTPFRAENLVAPDGGPRPICGEAFVPITADGAIVIPGLSIVYHPDYGGGDTEVSNVDGVVAVFCESNKDGTTFRELPVSACYSTEEASAASALAARGEVGNG